MANQTPPFNPIFGAGAPGGTVPHSAIYFDTSTTPYTPYVYDPTAAAWEKFGSAGTGANATALQGTPVSNAAPNNGDVLTYVGADLQWEPKASGAGSNPAIVNSATLTTANVSTGLTVPAPTQNNVLVAIVTLTSTSAPATGAGWSLIIAASRYAVYYKVAGAGESTTQVPSSSALAGGIAYWELSNAAATASTSINLVASGTAILLNAFNQKPSSALVLAACFDTSNTAQPTSVTGGTIDSQNAASGSTAITGCHATSAVQGNNALTFNFALSRTVNLISVAIG